MLVVRYLCAFLCVNKTIGNKHIHVSVCLLCARKLKTESRRSGGMVAGLEHSGIHVCCQEPKFFDFYILTAKDNTVVYTMQSRCDFSNLPSFMHPLLK